jgi:hypothetical protein
MFVRNKMFVGNIIWFNPPFSKNLSSNIARYFPYEHCPKSNLLHRILSKAENVKSAIFKRVVAKAESTKSSNKMCNCRTPSEWPLQKKMFKEECSSQGSDQNKGRRRNERIGKRPIYSL